MRRVAYDERDLDFREGSDDLSWTSAVSGSGEGKKWPRIAPKGRLNNQRITSS